MLHLISLSQPLCIQLLFIQFLRYWFQVVGAANAVAAGWGNLGGGFIQLVMPLVFELIAGPIGMAQFTAWRLSFLLPALIQGCVAIAVVFLGQVRGKKREGGFFLLFF